MENSSRSLPVACKGRVFCRMRRGREAEEAGRGLARNIHAAAHETGTGAGQEGKTEEKGVVPLAEVAGQVIFPERCLRPAAPPRGFAIVRPEALEYDSWFETLRHSRTGKRWSIMKTALEIIQEHAEEGAKLRRSFLADCAPVLDAAARCMARSLAHGGKILVCGNGGSAADAQHMTGELLGRFLMERPSLPAVALNVDTSTLTAVGNDYGYEEVFARQVSGLGRPGDVLVAFSTSGGSANVIKAIEAARGKGMAVVGLTGKGGGRMASMCDHLLNVPHSHTPLIQEMHEACMHLLCQLIDHYLFENVQALSEGPKGA